MEDIKDLNSIKLLVDEFYKKVRADELLVPVFSDVIKDDWRPHLEKMYAFWNSVLFGVPGFKGNPFARHVPLPIDAGHFDRWINMFNETVAEHFEGEKAEEAKSRAGMIAVMFQSKLAAIKNGKRIIL